MTTMTTTMMKLLYSTVLITLASAITVTYDCDGKYEKPCGDYVTINTTDLSEGFCSDIKITSVVEWNEGDVVGANFFKGCGPFNMTSVGQPTFNSNLSGLFFDSTPTDSINHWDVSRVKTMDSVFQNSHFNGDISGWNVGNVKSMTSMFRDSHFNGDISKWNVGKLNLHSTKTIFTGSHFNGDISSWS